MAHLPSKLCLQGTHHATPLIGDLSTCLLLAFIDIDCLYSEESPSLPSDMNLLRRYSPEYHFLLFLMGFAPLKSPGRTLVAFHPRPQIASDLGRNVTRNFNPHRNRSQFPSGNEILAYGRRFKSQPASTRCDLRIASQPALFYR